MTFLQWLKLCWTLNSSFRKATYIYCLNLLLCILSDLIIINALISCSLIFVSIAVALYALYSIYHFCNPNKEMIHQYSKILRKKTINNWDDPNKKFAIMVFSQDSKLFFSCLNDYMLLQNLGYNVLPIFNKNLAKPTKPCAKKEFLTKIFCHYPRYRDTKQNKKKMDESQEYEKKRIDALLILEHGNPTSIQDFMDISINRKLVANDTKIILHSCSNAGGDDIQNSIAAQIAKNNPESTVYAAKDIIDTIDIQNLEEGKISFSRRREKVPGVCLRNSSIQELI